MINGSIQVTSAGKFSNINLLVTENDDFEEEEHLKVSNFKKKGKLIS
jgi:hypothetical protein